MSAGPVNPVERRFLSLHPIVDGVVELAGGFWGARQRLNREVTIPYGMQMLEESGTIENFRIAAGSSRAEYRLPLFRDSDLYKVLEAIAWERTHGREADQERFFASSVEAIAAAQERDGYVNSYVRVVEKGHRFGDPAMGHELYCAGHLIQASVADTRTSEDPGALAGIANRSRPCSLTCSPQSMLTSCRVIPRSRLRSSSCTGRTATAGSWILQPI